MANAQRKEASFEEIREILREVSEGQQKTDRQMKETGRQMKETGRQMKETDRIIKENAQETDRKMQETDRIIKENARETDRQMKETDRRLKELNKLFTGQWGKLMESLVEGELVNLLKEKGIEVGHTATNLKDNTGERRWEVDILAVNGDEVVAVEVKTTLNVEYVDRFVDFLKDFKTLLREHRDKKVYGAVAYLRADQSSDIYAEKQGLYVIRATGNSAKIINGKGFRARKF